MGCAYGEVRLFTVPFKGTETSAEKFPHMFFRSEIALCHCWMVHPPPSWRSDPINPNGNTDMGSLQTTGSQQVHFHGKDKKVLQEEKLAFSPRQKAQRHD